MTAWLRHALADLARTTRGPGPRLALAWLLLVAVVGALAPLAGYPVGGDVDPSRASLGPSLAAPLGTDHLGRSVAWRLALAGRAFLEPGLLAGLVAAGLGVPTGALAGRWGGGLDQALRYLGAVVASVPRFVLVLLALMIYGHGPVRLGLAIGLTYVPELSEAVRTRIEGLRGREFVVASVAHGVPEARLLWGHLVLGATHRVLAHHLVRVFAFTVVVESTLAYLGGFGVQEPTPSWGNMLVFEWGRPLGASSLAPGAALWGTLLACAVLGRALGSDDA